MWQIPPPPPAFVLMSMSNLVSKASTTMWAGEWDCSADMVASRWSLNKFPSQSPYCPTDHGLELEGVMVIQVQAPTVLLTMAKAWMVLPIVIHLKATLPAHN